MTQTKRIPHIKICLNNSRKAINFAEPVKEYSIKQNPPDFRREAVYFSCCYVRAMRLSPEVFSRSWHVRVLSLTGRRMRSYDARICSRVMCVSSSLRLLPQANVKLPRDFPDILRENEARKFFRPQCQT